MGGGGDIVMPQQQSYGESLAEALKAQAEFLQGTGAFAETGSLESLLPLEESVRKKTAQTDTDVLRQTLLGNQTGEVSGTYDDQGRLVIGQTQKSAGQAPTLELKETSPRKYSGYTKAGTTPVYQVVDQRGKVYGTVGGLKFGGGSEKVPGPSEAKQMSAIRNQLDEFQSRAVTEFERTPEGQGEGEVVPVYARDPEGNIITDTSKIGQTEVIPATRQGDGMVDLLGDRREIVDYQTRQATEADVAAGLASEVGESITEAVGTGRQAGFSDTGEFQGAAALAEDIAAGSTSRQRERDIADVERLSGRFKTIMDEFKPAAATGISDAKLLLTQQRENLTGLREATQADVDRDPTIKLGDMIQTGTGSNVISTPQKIGTRQATQDDVDLGLAANVGDVIKPFSLSGEAGLDRVAGADTDTLRAMLLSEAKAGLGEGLTEREKARIREGFKGQSTMMGRTFDQSAGIAEAEAQMKEDNLRRLQNLGIAQSQLGQEAGLQAGDIARTMSADQFNVATQMDAETKNEQLRQQGLANYIAAVGNLAQIEDQYTLDPFRAILGRGANDTLGAGQGVLGSASYGLQSAPQYLNPEAGLGYISQMAANNANIAAAQSAASGSTMGGLFQGLGALGGGIAQGFIGCWVAREVYGPTNPSWLRFRLWMFSESPDWFFKLYNKYGERFASWISDKPRIKSFIRKWMDSKIKE